MGFRRRIEWLRAASHAHVQQCRHVQRSIDLRDGQGLTSSAPITTATITSGGGGTPAVTMVGAGDIAKCTVTGDEITAKLLDGIAGTVFTLGDNVYPNGALSDFNNCYHGSWGRHKSRTRPSVGNHEYQTPGGAGYYSYFGAAAGDPSKGYYSYNLGA